MCFLVVLRGTIMDQKQEHTPTWTLVIVNVQKMKETHTTMEKDRDVLESGDRLLGTPTAWKTMCLAIKMYMIILLPVGISANDCCRFVI